MAKATGGSPPENASEIRNEATKSAAKTPEPPDYPEPARYYDSKHQAAFWEWMEQIPREVWNSRLTLYLYRRWPVIVRPPDVPHYIDCLAHPIDRAELLRRWGAGEYTIRIIDAGRPRSSQLITEALVDCTEPWEVYPPVLNPEELDRLHPRNKAFIEWLEARSYTNPKPPEQAGDASTRIIETLAKTFRDTLDELLRQRNAQRGMDAEAFSKSLDVIATAIREQVQATLNKPSETDQFVRFVEAVRSLQPQKPPLDPLALAGVIKDAIALTAQILARKEATPPPPQMPDPLEYINRFMEAVQRFEDLRPNPTRRSTMEQILQALPAIPSLLRELRTMTPVPAEGGQNVGLIAQLAQPLLQHLESGATGQEFAQWIVDGWGAGIYSMIQALGIDSIKQLLFNIPELAARLQAYGPRVDTFLQEFMAWTPDWLEHAAGECQ